MSLLAAGTVVDAGAGGGMTTGERLYRARRIGTTFGRVYLGIRANRFIARRIRPGDMRERWSSFNTQSAESIYDAAVELRGLILKGCQFLGTRADVLPREYVKVLSRLQDRVPPKPFRVVRDTVERELARPLEEVFAEFSRRPIAAASLAQVHDATLRDGRRVAVKIQYPEIEDLVRADLGSLRVLFRAVGYLERDFDLGPLLDELSEHVPRELDFVSEGRNAERVAALFEGRDDVAVPAVHWAWTSRRLLVMEFMEGVKITDTAQLRRAGLDVDRVATLLAEVFGEQILRHGFFHADPHPGNLLVQTLPSGAPRLVLLDFGLAKELPEGFRAGAVRFAAALLQGSPDAMAAALLELGFETRGGSPADLVRVARSVLDAALAIRERGGIEPALAEQLGEKLADELRDHPIVRVPSHVVLLGRALGLLSGVNRTLDARLDLVRTLLPYALPPPPRS